MEPYHRIAGQSTINFPREMDFFGNRYYALNRLTMSISGIWPYQHWCARTVIVILILIFLVTAMIAMICKVLTTEKSLDSLTYSFQFTVPDIVFISNVAYFSANTTKLKTLLEHIKSDWDLLQPTDTSIILKFAETGRMYTLILTATSIALPVSQFIALSLATELAKRKLSNGSHQLELPVPVEYFIDSEKNRYYIYLHFGLAFMSGIFVSLSIASLYISSVQHARGMFDIVGHRFETMFDDIGEGLSCDEEEKMGTSIMFHKRAIEFIDTLNSVYGPLYLTEAGLFVFLLTINIFRLFQAYVNSDGIGVCALHVFSVFVCMLVYAITGQELLDRSSKLLVRAYASQWYLAPVSLQKSVVFIMARSFRESSIKITRTIIVSYELLVSILQMSVSYFMAMCNFQ